MNKVKEILKDILIKLRLYYRIKDKKFYDSDQNKIQLEFYKKIINKGDLVFDIGGNVGQRSKLFLDLGAKVVAFEPQPYCINHLQSRFYENKNFTLEKCALGDKEDNLKLFLSNHHTISSLSEKQINKFAKRVFKDAVFDKSVIVPVKKLEDMFKKHGIPKFIKIDVEGYEKNVFMGMESTAPYISFEFTPVKDLIEDTQECLSRLYQINNNYLFNYTLGEELKFENAEWLPYEKFLNKIDFNNLRSFGDIYAKIES